jgi:hypothetical protein
MKNKAIEEFWHWLVDNRTIIESVINGESADKRNDIIEALDNYVLSFGRIKWVLDQPVSGAFQLILSPNRDLEIWKITQKLVRHAPSIDHWQFFSAIPPNGQFMFDIYDDYMDTHTINTKNWSIGVEDRSNGAVRIFVSSAANQSNLDPENFLVAIQIGLTNILGEEQVMRYVDGVEVLDESKWKSNVKRSSLETLANLLKS